LESGKKGCVLESHSGRVVSGFAVLRQLTKPLFLKKLVVAELC